MWKNIVQPDRLQVTIWWIPKSANIHSEYVKRNVFSLQQWMHESASIVRYAYSIMLILFLLSSVSFVGFFFFFSIYPTYSLGTSVLSRGWSFQGVKLTSYLLLVPILRMGGDIPLLPLYAFMAWALKALPLRFTATLLSPFLFCFLCLCKCVNANWSMRLSLRAACVSFITATNFIKTLPLLPTHGMFSPLLVCQ